MKAYLTLALMVFGSSAFAQKSETIKVLAKYNIEASVLDQNTTDNTQSYAFDLKQTTSAGGKDKIEIASYDPAKPEDDRWTLTSVDGQNPTNAQIKSFKNAHKTSTVGKKADDSSYKIVKDDKETVVISYKLDPALLDKDSGFMKDCITYLHFDTKSARMTKLETINEKPLRIKILNVPKLDTDVNFVYMAADKKYLPDNQKVMMTIKLLGQEVDTVIETVYSNYRKKI